MFDFRKSSRFWIVLLLVALVPVVFLTQESAADNESKMVLVTPNGPSQLRASLPLQHGTDQAEFAAHIKSEASQLLFGLRVANKEISCDNQPTPCLLTTAFQDVVKVLEIRCSRLDVGSLRQAAAYSATQNGRVLGAIESACHTIRAAHASQGEPHESALWIRDVQVARAAMSEVEGDLR